MALAAPAEARAERPLIAVVPFTGPQAKHAEAVVVRVLRKKAQLVPPSKWASSANKLFARSHSADNIAAVALDVGARVVVTGVVKREGRGWQLVVSLRDGPTGHSRDKLKYPLKGPRLLPRTLALLASEIDQAYEHALAASAGNDDEAPPPKNNNPPRNRNPPPPDADNTPPPPPPPPMGKRGRGKPVKVAKGDDDDTAPPPPPPPATDDAQPPPSNGPPPPPPPAPSTKRPRWAPYFDLSFGGTVSGRSFSFSTPGLPQFSSTVVGGIHVDLTVYPMAMLWQKAGGILATLGLGVTLDKPFWPPSTARMNPGLSFPTSELRVEGGLRWRFVLYKPLPRPELLLLVGGGLHTFSIAKIIDMNNNAADVGPPDVAYAYVTVGGGIRLHFAEWARIFATFAYQAVLDAGSATTDGEYGPANTFGLRVTGGLEFFVWRGLKLSGAGFYDRYTFAFAGTGALMPAQAATDQYFGGIFCVGYEL